MKEDWYSNMYLHIGNDYLLNSNDIIGIFDIDMCSIERRFRDYLLYTQRENIIVDAAEDLPSSFIVTTDRVYISGISTGTLRQRSRQVV